MLQYEVKLQEFLECGGAYVKLLSENEALHENEFSNDSPYQVMFGPDKCGSVNKVHFIIRRKNPKTGEYEEKHLKRPASARLNRSSNLYTLIIKPDQDFEVRINGEVVRAGNLHEDGVMFPSVNPPKEIDDEDDVKPEDWIDDEFMPDPEQAVKPSDWDETEPLRIPDPDAVKPDDWDEDALEYIPDPDAEKPEDWDDEEDGDFVAPEVANPDCELHGCGPWKAPLVPNPKYKGKWTQPLIPNPEYNGVWAPRQIPNPDYFNDETPSDLEPIGGIGIELWTMQKNILFDNFYLGHSIEEAEAFGNATFVPKLAIERAEEEAEAEVEKAKERKTYNSHSEHIIDNPIDFFKELARSFILNMSVDPLGYIQNQPILFIGCVTFLFGMSTVGFALLGVVYVLLKAVITGQPIGGETPVAKTEEKEVTGKPIKPTGTSSAVPKKTLAQRTEGGKSE